MLVLSRERDQEIIIDGRIVVTVTDIRGEKVRLGITAPAGVRIDRMEVHQARERGEPDPVHVKAPPPPPATGEPRR